MLEGICSDDGVYPLYGIVYLPRYLYHSEDGETYETWQGRICHRVWSVWNHHADADGTTLHRWRNQDGGI
jgi:hypothetical protein